MKLFDILNYDLEPFIEPYFDKICNFIESQKEKEEQKQLKQVANLLPYFIELEVQGFDVADAALEHDFIEHGLVSHLFGMPNLIYGAESMSQDDEHNKFLEGLADMVSFFLQSKGKKKPSRVFGNMLNESDINFYWALLEESNALQYLSLYNLMASQPEKGWKLINSVRCTHVREYNLAIAL